jgi:hypothetical protein
MASRESSIRSGVQSDAPGAFGDDGSGRGRDAPEAFRGMGLERGRERSQLAPGEGKPIVASCLKEPSSGSTEGGFLLSAEALVSGVSEQSAKVGNRVDYQNAQERGKDSSRALLSN